ncbi:MAG: transcription elongation factor GreA [Candidatus Loosdrechtia sp.]|uniref:transcription elongation factor GreA n=1 Tax=Candidatus Loosdrechtia sp. TaxID=3101272 RepID=UPI003A6C0D01|nr:MAG: transcription elongation factor GreA [Candidatus Jettenia sp. AMX2]
MLNECFATRNDLDISELISFVNTEQYDKLEDAWLTIVESGNKDIQFLLDVVDVLIKREEKRRAHDLLTTLIPYYKGKEQYCDVLKVLKRILEHNPHAKGLISEVTECYVNIYKNRPYAKDIVERMFGNVEVASAIHNAIKKLERYFYLDCGDYVYHKSWGVGKVISIDTLGERIHIDFEKKSNHSIAMDIAPDILQKLDKDDLLAMMYAQKEVLHGMISDDPVGLIKLALKFFRGKASVSQVKNRLVSGIIPPEAWSKWWTNTKKLVRKDPYIKLTDGTPANSFLELRASPITQHKEVLENLIYTKDVSEKVETARKYLSELKDTEQCMETLNEIKAIFIQEVNTLNQTNPPLAAECLLLLKGIQGFMKEDATEYVTSAKTAISTNENLPEFIHTMNILEYRKQILCFLKEAKPEKWQEEFVSIFFTNDGNLWEFIVKELIAENKQNSLEELSLKIFNHFNAYPEHYIWFCKNGMCGRYPELYKNIDIAIMFNRLIELSDNIYFKIQKGRDGNLKTIANKIKNLLENRGVDYVSGVLDDANAESIFNVVSSSKGLEDWFKVAVENIIQDRFPDMFEKPGLPELDENKIYVTKEGFEKRKKEFDHLMNVEFAENARDLGEAISRGDLRENAEYKAAREKQALLVEKGERMKAELQKVVIIEPSSVHSDTVSPGVKVTIKNKEKAALEIYTLLGPWDTNIEEGIISYLSPIGKGLINKQAGDIVTIKLPEGECTYEIVKIEKAI